MSNHKICIIMGVSGTGKSTIGKMLAERLDVPFFDGDDFHPKANIEKMAAGLPLNDTDRLDWLKALNQLEKKYLDSGAVIACSALKESYRKILRSDLEEQLIFIHLEGSFELIKKRMEARKGHFMPLKLLRSQFDTLESPKEAINISIADSPTEIVDSILNQLS